MKQTLKKSKDANTVLGVKLLGPKAMEAFNFYNNMGNYFFDLATKNKGILPAAKANYIIAAENLN